MLFASQALEVAKATSSEFPHLRAYKKSIKEFDVLTALEAGEIARMSPWTGRRILVTGSIFLGKYHAYRLEEDDNSALEILYAGKPVALLPKGSRTAFQFNAHGYPTVLLKMLAKLEKEWPRMSPEPAKSWAMFVGDTRPLHFLADCAAFIFAEQDRLRAMPVRPRIIQSPTMAFIGLDTLFGTLLNVTTLKSEEIRRYCRKRNILLISGWRFRRPQRRVLRRFLDWLDDKFSGTQSGANLNIPRGALVVSIGLDIEKDRFVGQEEFIDLILQRLHAFATKTSRPLAIFWDGWTVKAGERGAKDEAVIASLDNFAGKAEARFGAKPDVVFRRIYEMTLIQKIAFFEFIDCFFATRGTASVIPGVLKEKPGFCYHNPVELKTNFPFRYTRAITLDPSKSRFLSKIADKPSHLWKYTFDLAEVPSIEMIMNRAPGSQSSPSAATD